MCQMTVEFTSFIYCVTFVSRTFIVAIVRLMFLLLSALYMRAIESRLNTKKSKDPQGVGLAGWLRGYLCDIWFVSMVFEPDGETFHGCP